MSGKPHKLTKEELNDMPNPAKNWSIFIKSADKGSDVVAWDWEDYLVEEYKQLSDETTYTDVNNLTRKALSDFTDNSDKNFKRLCNKNIIITPTENVSKC